MDVTISRFKATCLELLRVVQKTGEPLVITRLGEPIAQVVPATRKTRDRSGLFGKAPGKIKDDIIAPASGASDWEALQDKT